MAMQSPVFERQLLEKLIPSEFSFHQKPSHFLLLFNNLCYNRKENLKRSRFSGPIYNEKREN